MQPRCFAYYIKHFLDRDITPGQDISLSGLPAHCTAKDAACNVSYINEVISAANGKGQLSLEKGFRHRRETPALEISRSDYPGWEYNAGVQPVTCCVKNQVCGNSFTLGVCPVNKIGREIPALRDNMILRNIRHYMNGADINQSADIVFSALANDVVCPFHIDRIDDRIGIGSNGNDTGTMNHAGVYSRAVKKGLKRFFIENIAGDALNPLWKLLRIRVVG